MTTPLQMFEDTIEDHCDEVHEAASEAAERLLDMTQARAVIESAAPGDVEAIRARLRALFAAAVDIAVDMAIEDAACDGHPAGLSDPMGRTVFCDGSCKVRR